MMRREMKEILPNDRPQIPWLVTHYYKLEQISKFDDKLKYWEQHLIPKGYSYFTQLYLTLSDKTELFLALLPYDGDSSSDRKVIRAIIKPMLDSESTYGSQLINEFLQTVETLEVLDETKEGYLEDIDALPAIQLQTKSYRQVHTRRGFAAFKGLFTLEEATERIYKTTKGNTRKEYEIQSAFEGFMLAYARKFIKDYTKKKELINPLYTNYIGLLIAAFDLQNNQVFKDLKLSDVDKSKVFIKALNLDSNDATQESLRKAFTTPKGKVSKAFLKWFKQEFGSLGIDVSDTNLKKYLP